MCCFETSKDVESASRCKCDFVIRVWKFPTTKAELTPTQLGLCAAKLDSARLACVAFQWTLHLCHSLPGVQWSTDKKQGLGCSSVSVLEGFSDDKI
jgi:hypothetical protein